MNRRLLLPLLGVLLVAGAPGASAHIPDAYGCRILNARQDEVTGHEVWTGVAVGWAVAADASAGTIRCDVQINGVVHASTPTSAGQGVLTTAGDIVYPATETDSVRLCVHVEWSDGHVFRDCANTLLVTLVPQEFADAVMTAVETANNQAGCVTAVNTGTCSSGVCVVNAGTCEGGVCAVNLGYCGRGCIAVVNTVDCGRHPNGWVDP